MMDGYGSQADFMKRVQPSATERITKVEKALRNAFKNVIKLEEVEVIPFSEIGAVELGRAIEKHPIILKSLLAACNIGARAIERDLQIKNLDTYREKISSENAQVIAGYIKPFLPSLIPLPSLVHIDRVEFIDKEIRKAKGQWEKLVLNKLNKLAEKKFKKRKFEVAGQSFEIDAASPSTGKICIGIDIKRIEARRDIHKRCDEIVNKSLKFKEVYPDSKFGVVIYYPFIEEHSNVQDRLRSDAINSIVFASESGDSIFSAVKILLSKLKVR
ncbi:MAG: hypothetical protein KAW47_10270 [Thermoplasmatales archaeon]|nr:hypothetical protein [Thermoplasmatales archaeon]